MVPTDLTTPEVSMAEKMLFGALVNGTERWTVAHAELSQGPGVVMNTSAPLPNPAKMVQTNYSGPGTWLPPGNSRSRDPPASDRARPLMDADRTGQPSQCRQLPKAKG
ncbi:unnamed protein product [Rangifer tarandus platyrhynchus]|uniref:Uncharacterized protein n=1 Tax=Rangifer tarandus platyrhynchus TaxID=3082113 RepID=A0ABN8ZT12_RANTA|nr:unnamed protein product [Rangifer tarandus platyrhynchus]